MKKKLILKNISDSHLVIHEDIGLAPGKKLELSGDEFHKVKHVANALIKSGHLEASEESEESSEAEKNSDAAAKEDAKAAKDKIKAKLKELQDEFKKASKERKEDISKEVENLKLEAKQYK